MWVENLFFSVYSLYFHCFFFSHHLQKSGSFHWRHLFSLNFMFTCVGTMPENSCLLLNRKVLSYASLYTSHFVNFCINLGFGSMFSSFSTFSSLSLLAQGPVTTPPLIEKTIFVCLIVCFPSFLHILSKKITWPYLWGSVSWLTCSPQTTLLEYCNFIVTIKVVWSNALNILGFSKLSQLFFLCFSTQIIK